MGRSGVSSVILVRVSSANDGDWFNAVPLKYSKNATVLISTLMMNAMPVIAAQIDRAPLATPCLRAPIPSDFSPASNVQSHLVLGAMVIHKGSRFDVALLQPIDSCHTKSGDRIRAALVDPIKAQGVIIANAGATVTGWVATIHSQRCSMKARLSSRNWLNSSAIMSVHFNEIGDHQVRLAINAEAAPNTSFPSSTNVRQSVDKHGAVVVDFHGAKYIGAGVGISAISLAAGPAALIVGPALSGALGAAVPEYALDRPVPHKSCATVARGTVTGAFKGLPGGTLVTGFVNKGLPVSLPAGEIMTLELKEDLVIDTAVAAP